MREPKLWITCLAGLLCLSLGASSRAWPQQSATASPNPGDHGPTLAVTMQFIQDKINNRGANLDRFYYPDGGGVSPGDDGQILKVTADPSNCLIKVAVSHADPTQQIFTMVASLKDVQKVTAGLNRNPSMLEIRAARGVFQLRSEFDFGAKGIRLPQPKMYDDSVAAFSFHFRDPDMADRVGKAAQHAVELCGGGPPSSPGRPKEPF